MKPVLLSFFYLVSVITVLTAIFIDLQLHAYNNILLIVSGLGVFFVGRSLAKKKKR